MRLALALVLSYFYFSNSSFAQREHLFPLAPKDTTTNTYHGVTIEDPYQWMENPYDPRLEGWLELQAKHTQKTDRKQTRRDILQNQLASLYQDIQTEEVNKRKALSQTYSSKYEFDYKTNRDDRSYNLLYKERGATNYRMLMRMKDYANSKDERINVEARYVNDKENVAAIEISRNGGDWHELYFFDLKTGISFGEKLENIRASSNLIWRGKAVYYDAYEKPRVGRELLDKARGQKLYYHKLGTNQVEDLMVYQNPDTTGTNSFRFFKRDEKIFFYNFFKRKSRLYKSLSIANSNPEQFFLKPFLVYPNDDKISMTIYDLIGDTVLLETTWNAPNGKVLKANINALNQLKELIPEYDAVLRDVEYLGQSKVAATYQKNGNYLLLIYSLDGELLKPIEIPEGKKVTIYEPLNGNDFTQFKISSFYQPDLWYRLSVNDLTFVPIESVSVPYDPDDLETRFVQYPSKDGTMIPMYITCKKDLELDGTNPTLIYAYGGYGTTVEPRFDEQWALWMLHGGVLAVPNIRGGGGLGREWALAGRNLNKNNSIDDLIAASEFLIEKKYTNPNKLSMNGSSHGGLMVAAAMVRKPELYNTVISEAGPHDVLRSELFTSGGVSINLNEYGSIAKEEEFKNMLSYSPLHNVQDGVRYPEVLLTTGQFDDRVPPFNSFKFLATLQEKGDPMVNYQMYVIPGSGHDTGITQTDFTNAILFKYMYLFDNLGVKID